MKMRMTACSMISCMSRTANKPLAEPFWSDALSFLEPFIFIFMCVFDHQAGRYCVEVTIEHMHTMVASTACSIQDITVFY